jgi:hypothetical protein
MSTLELENIKHPDNSGNNIELAADGKIGIGIAPNSALHVKTPAFTDSILTIDSTSTNVSQRINFSANGTIQSQIYDDAVQTKLFAITNKHLVFGTNNNERMRVASDGNIGIGTTTPSEKLVVEDSANGAFIDIVGASSGDIASGIRVKQGSTTRGGFYTNPTHDMTIISDSGMTFRTNNANSNSIDSNGIFTNTTKPYFFAYSDAVNASLNPNVLCPFNLLLEYQGPNAYNTSTHRYTAPVAGIYQFNVHVYGNNSTNLHSFAIRVNGSIRSRSSGYGNSQSDTYVSGSASFKLTANDYVDVVSSGSGIVNFYGGSQTIYSTWSGYLVG